MKCKDAVAAGRFADELVPIKVESGKKSYDVTADEPPRPDTTLEALAKLKPAFRAGGTVTAGNSSPLNDGAAALLVCSVAAAERYGWTPMARVITSATFGVDPSIMGIGPIGATRKALAKSKPYRRRPRSGRAQRGLRRAVGRLRQRAGDRSRRSST